MAGFMFLYMVDYIDGFSYVEPFLHPWYEAYLITVYDFSDVFLDSIFQYFIEYFCISVHKLSFSLFPGIYSSWVFEMRYEACSLLYKIVYLCLVVPIILTVREGFQMILKDLGLILLGGVAFEHKSGTIFPSNASMLSPYAFCFYG
ncbi:hypothetical protein H671_3g9247 [Cricetulus griseus]|uniref:Uncharacterized protein n=1 Tax=Cricetulus griseus TaxID=10029 RepID=A0A061IGA6_CRIGR|nr:hypothetical protein H671_3g9247 [Cricetulus griseus]